MATELGKAYIQIMPSAKGISGSITKTLSGESKSAGKSAGSSIVSGIKKVIAVAGIGKFLGASLREGAALEQSMGGIETLFKNHSDEVKKYANEAYKTAGLSANAYMENVTKFSASLLQSLGGDTEKAAEKSNMAMIDMADNSNKMGTSMESIQNAYSGFAKSNYTMLDNLALGYGGTKGEMERLLKDATKLSGVKYDISNLSDVYDAIHVVQDELGITGTTALESAETFSGSLASMKSAYSNVLGNLALGEDVKPALEGLSGSVLTFLDNLLPMVSNILGELPTLLVTILKTAGPEIIGAGAQAIADLIQGLSQTLPTLIPIAIDAVMLIADSLLDNLDVIIDSGIELVAGLTLGLVDAIPKLIEKIPVIIDSMVKSIVDNLPMIIEAGWKLNIALVKGIIKAIPQLIKAMPQILGAIGTGLRNGLSHIANIGTDIVKGLWQGIKDATGWLLDKVKGFGRSIENGIKKFFGIKSPSTLFRDEVGKNLSLGLAEGIEGNAKPVTKAMEELSELTTSSFDAGLAISNDLLGKEFEGSVAYSSLNNGGGNIIIEKMEVRDDTDIEKIARELYSLQNRRLRGRFA